MGMPLLYEALVGQSNTERSSVSFFNHILLSWLFSDVVVTSDHKSSSDLLAATH